MNARVGLYRHDFALISFVGIQAYTAKKTLTGVNSQQAPGLDFNEWKKAVWQVIQGIPRGHVLTYGEVAAFLDGSSKQSVPKPLQPAIRELQALYRAFAQARSRRGAIEIDLPQTKFKLNKDGEIDRIEIVPDPDVRILGLRAGEFDMIETDPSLIGALEGAGLDAASQPANACKTTIRSSISSTPRS